MKPYSRTDALLDDWATLRAHGLTREEAAERLGLSVAGLERMCQRHRDDPRARIAGVPRRREPRELNWERPRSARGRWVAA